MQVLGERHRRIVEAVRAEHVAHLQARMAELKTQLQSLEERIPDALIGGERRPHVRESVLAIRILDSRQLLVEDFSPPRPLASSQSWDARSCWS